MACPGFPGSVAVAQPGARIAAVNAAQRQEDDYYGADYDVFVVTKEDWLWEQSEQLDEACEAPASVQGHSALVTRVPMPRGFEAQAADLPLPSRDRLARPRRGQAPGGRAGAANSVLTITMSCVHQGALTRTVTASGVTCSYEELPGHCA